MRILQHIICFWAAFLVFCSTYSVAGNPKAEYILDKFSSEYRFNHNYVSYYSLIKKQDGFYVKIFPIDTIDTIEVHKIFDTKQQKFENIEPTRLISKSHSMNLNHSIKKSFYNYHHISTGRFDLQPMFGYDGWCYDVINSCKGKKVYDDTGLYALADAYSYKVVNEFTCGFLGYHGDNSCYSMLNEDGGNALTLEELQRFITESDTALNLYKELYERYPKFQTDFGNAYHLYCNQVVNRYLMLTYFQNSSVAKKYLPDSLYSPHWISLAKNYLNSCPKNAILFTFNDNDTYPLLYVQAKKKFRKDVLVVNANLCNLSRYITYLARPHQYVIPMDLTMAVEHYHSPVSEYMYIQPEGNKKIMIDSLLKKLHQPDFGSTTDSIHKILPSATFVMGDMYDEPMEWKTSRHFLLRSDLLMLDAISHYKNRPVCFASGAPAERYFGLENYLRCDGLVYRLTNEYRRRPQSMLLSEVDWDNAYRIIKEEYDWEALGEMPEDKGAQKYINHFIQNLNSIGASLAAMNKKDSALAILDLRFLKLPVEDNPDDIVMDVHVTQIYFAAGRVKTVEAMSRRLLRQIVNARKKDYKENVKRQAIEAVAHLISLPKYEEVHTALYSDLKAAILSWNRADG